MDKIWLYLTARMITCGLIVIFLSGIGPGMAYVSAPQANASVLPDKPLTDQWKVDGTVNDIVLSGDTIYIGGEFSELYRDLNTGYAVPLDSIKGYPTVNYPFVDGEVKK